MHTDPLSPDLSVKFYIGLAKLSSSGSISKYNMVKQVTVTLFITLGALVLIGAGIYGIVSIGNTDNTSSVSRESKPCQRRNFGYNSDVCVCNNTYCDEFPPLPEMTENLFVSYTTTKAGLRFNQETFTMLPVTSNSTFDHGYINVSAGITHQKIIGFGGAFTDAAGINILSLEEEASNKILESYFGSTGIEYNLGRIPMAGCDFSLHAYTYNDNEGNLNMSQFALQYEDFTYKIPLIKKALDLSSKHISFFGSPWTAPAWMKDSNSYTGRGSLIGEPGGEYYQAWALYFARFIQAYEKEGIDMWGVTGQNEPFDGRIENFPFQCMGFTPEQQRDFIKLDLGPTLADEGFSDVKIMMLDDQRIFMRRWVDTILSDPDAAKYIDGIAVHWYTDYIFPPTVLTETHMEYPDKFLIGSEACAGEIPWLKYHVQLGNWFRAQRYSVDIIQDFEHFVSGWTDWNLALNMEGGPNWVENHVDALIIVNADDNEFYKQPSYYHMGHFSKFISDNYFRVETELFDLPTSVKKVGFIAPDGETRVLVVINMGDEDQHISIYDRKANVAAEVTLEAESIKTFVYKV